MTLSHADVVGSLMAPRPPVVSMSAAPARERASGTRA